MVDAYILKSFICIDILELPPRVDVDVNLLQTKTRSQSKVLQVRVMHHTVVAHQHFAQQLIKWLEKIIEFSGKALLILSQGKNAALLHVCPASRAEHL